MWWRLRHSVDPQMVMSFSICTEARSTFMFQSYISLITASTPAKSAPFCIISLPTSPCRWVVFFSPLTVKSVMQGSVLAPSMNTDCLYTLWPFWYVHPCTSLLNSHENKFSFHFIHYLDQFRIFSQLFLLLKEYNQIHILKVTRQDEVYSSVSPFFYPLLPFLRTVCVSSLRYQIQLNFVGNLPKYLFIIFEIVLIWKARLSSHSVL